MKHSNSGSTMMAVLMLMAVTSLMIAAVYLTTTNEARFMRRSVDRAAAIAYGSGVLESLYDQWRMAMTNTTDHTAHQNGLSNNELLNISATNPATSGLPLTAPGTSTLPLPAGITVGTLPSAYQVTGGSTWWSVVAADPYMNPITPGSSRPYIEAGTNSKLRVRMYYLASVAVNFPNGSVIVQRVFTRAGRNIFDNFLFSLQPVTEIHPGPDMYVNGTIYAGGDLYMAHSSLHLQQDVSYTGNMYLNFKGGPGAGYQYVSGGSTQTEGSSFWDSRYNSETPSIGSSAWPSNDPPHQGTQQKLLDTPVSSLNPNWYDDPQSNNTVDTTNYPNGSGYGEIIKTVSNSSVADPLQVDTSTSERLANNADYRIQVDVNNNVSIYKGASTTALSTTDAQYTAIKNALTTNTSIDDVRSGDNVRLVNVNVGTITTAFNAGTLTNTTSTASNGLLLYVQDTSYGTKVTNVNGYTVSSGTAKPSTTITSNAARGVRLTNGGTLPSGGLTIASPNPVYVQGDYNTGSTSSTYSSSAQPPSNNSSAYPTSTATPSPVLSSYTKAPAAIAADAVNILSNKWTDASAIVSISGGNAPTASATTVNAAIVAGNVPTTSSSYSGGIENFPRFLENWSSVNFTIYGSLALLYDSSQATGPWTSALYSPPNRRWFFDSLLQNFNPPGFPVAYSYDRGKWTLR